MGARLLQEVGVAGGTAAVTLASGGVAATFFLANIPSGTLSADVGTIEGGGLYQDVLTYDWYSDKSTCILDGEASEEGGGAQHDGECKYLYIGSFSKRVPSGEGRVFYDDGRLAFEEALSRASFQAKDRCGTGEDLYSTKAPSSTDVTKSMTATTA